MSEVPLCRPAVPDDSNQCPSSRDFHHLPLATHDPVQGPVVWTSCLGDKGPGLSSHEVDSCHGRLVPWPEGSPFQPAVLDELHLGPSSRGVDQLSWTTRAHFGGPAGSTRIPGRLGPLPEYPWCRSTVPGDSGTFPKSRSVDLLPRPYWAIVQGPRVRSDVPGHLATCSRCCGVDQLSRMTRIRVRNLKLSSSCPGLLKSGSRARGFTSWPGRLVPGSEVPRV